MRSFRNIDTADLVMLFLGVIFGGLFGREILGPVWGALGSFTLGRLIRLGPGPTKSTRFIFR